MKKKLLTILITTLFICVSVFGMIGCGHQHTFGEWLDYMPETTNCEEKVFYRKCTGCNELAFKKGTYEDHDWQSTYTKNDAYHWIKCNNCEEIKDKTLHAELNEEYDCFSCGYSCVSTEGVLYTISEDGTYAEVCGYNGTETEVIIAGVYQGVPVTSIGDYAFKDCKSLTSITIPNSVTSIGDYAFDYCESLTSITMPNSVISIGNWVFNYCKALEAIEIPDSVTSIGSYAFSFCWGITSVEIPTSVKYIGFDVLYGCVSKRVNYLGTIDQWVEIEQCGSEMFFRCNDGLYIKDELITEANITKATKINTEAFYDCASLTSVTIGSSVTSIGPYAFACSSLEVIVIPNSVTSIGIGAFLGCSNLTIYCEAEEKPSGWHHSWNSSNCPVIWGYKG